MFKNFKRLICLAANSSLSFLAAASSYNQTPLTTPILLNQKLPFEIKVEQADFSLPNGIQSYAQASYNGMWLFITGRTNGMHSFFPGNNNFPPAAQNTVVYVVNPATNSVYTRDLADPTSGLTQHQVDLLSVTSAQFYTEQSTLYITGGYGVDTATGLFSTKDCLTAINIPGLMNWVINGNPSETALPYIRQIFNPVFRVTGGFMTKIRDNPTLLVFGQDFEGYYNTNSNGIYTEQVRRFNIIDDGVTLDVEVLASRPEDRRPEYRRRDLNVVPIIHYDQGRYRQKLIAYSGVFTVAGGIWNVPVVINSGGHSEMLSPYIPQSFKQGMNNYTCPTIGLFSKNSRDMYTIVLGGLSYGYYDTNGFQTDDEVPFINQITTIKYNKNGDFTQYLLDEEYPVILSTQSNPGNQLLFGAAAQFILARRDIIYGNGVLNLDALTEPTLIGYIVGGIQSTVPNTSVPSDSAASPYIFKVTLTPIN